MTTRAVRGFSPCLSEACTTSTYRFHHHRHSVELTQNYRSRSASPRWPWLPRLQVSCRGTVVLLLETEHKVRRRLTKIAGKAPSRVSRSSIACAGDQSPNSRSATPGRSPAGRRGHRGRPATRRRHSRRRAGPVAWATAGPASAGASDLCSAGSVSAYRWRRSRRGPI